MLKRLINSRFARNVALVATGTAGAQAITMAFSPVITRLYGPEAFGLLGTFTATLAIFMPIAALTYPIAIVLPKKDDDARGIAKLSLLLAFFISLLVAMILLFSDQAIARLLNLESIAPYLLLIPAAMFLNSLQQIMQQWLIRKKQFKVSARIAITQSLILNSAKTGVGFIHPAGAALIVLATLGNALYAIQLWLGAKRWTKPEDHIHRPKEQLAKPKTLAHQHRDFPFFRAPQITINALAQGLPILMLTSFFGPASAGFYSLSRAVLAMPTALIGKAVGDVFYPRINEATQKSENVFRLLLKATLSLGAIGIIPFGLIILFGPTLFTWVFGHDWIKAGEYSSWLALWLYFMFMNNPSNQTIPVLGLQRFYLFFSLTSTAIRAFALVLGFLLFQSDILAVALFSIAGALINIALISIVLWHSKRFSTSIKDKNAY